MSDKQKLDAIIEAIQDYYFKLDTRQHGGVAAGHALEQIEKTVGMSWVQGEEKKRRDDHIRITSR